MAELDRTSNRLVFKLVYYGPALSGKTTNLISLHDRLVPSRRGEIMMFDTREDRTLFFDLLPIGWRAPSGLLIKFKVYTVPGQVAHDSTRKAVLSRADGVCFVADSRSSQSINNAESFRNLEENAMRVGLDLERLPIVIQFNKRDLPDVTSEEELRQRWSQAPWPLVMASALEGRGVEETLGRLLESVCLGADRRYRLREEHGCSPEGLSAAILGRAGNHAHG